MYASFSRSRQWSRAELFRRRDGFTLVELLVVIGIIALLVSILLPVLNKARASAWGVSCLSQMRQVGLGVQAYASQHGGRLPYNHTQTNGVYIWNGIYSLVAGKHIDNNYLDDGMYRTRVLLCPAEPSEPGEWNDWAAGNIVFATYRNGIRTTVYTTAPNDLRQSHHQTHGYRVLTHYALNGNHQAWHGYFTLNGKTFGQLSNYATEGFWQGSQPQRKMSHTKSHSDVWIAVESSNSDITPARLVWRHPKLASNFAYLDGHAEPLKVGDVDAGPYPDHEGFAVYDERADMDR